MILSDKKASIHWTAVAWTLREGKVLLVKHKRLKIWLAPGGHIEPNEVPHRAALREFKEETGLTAEIISPEPVLKGGESEYLPTPFLVNLHWIKKPHPVMGYCEQHLAFSYFVDVKDLVGFGRQIEETDAIGWFSQEEIKDLETTEDIKQEALYVFDHFPKRQ